MHVSKCVAQSVPRASRPPSSSRPAGLPRAGGTPAVHLLTCTQGRVRIDKPEIKMSKNPPCRSSMAYLCSFFWRAVPYRRTACCCIGNLLADPFSRSRFHNRQLVRPPLEKGPARSSQERINNCNPAPDGQKNSHQARWQILMRHRLGPTHKSHLWVLEKCQERALLRVSKELTLCWSVVGTNQQPDCPVELQNACAFSQSHALNDALSSHFSSYQPYARHSTSLCSGIISTLGVVPMLLRLAYAMPFHRQERQAVWTLHCKVF